ncbi:MAG: pilus assembly PilX N-terminal domain-containing protein [Acidobacteriota bacterium]
MRTRVTHPGQEGSVFVMALFVVLILSLLGVTLALTTEFEAQAGSNERTIDRTFAAAETGMWAGITGLTVSGEWWGKRLAIVTGPEDPADASDDNLYHEPAPPNYMVGYRTGTTNLYMVAYEPAPWTDSLEDRPIQERYFQYFTLLSSRAQRVFWPGTPAAGPVTPFEEDGTDPDDVEVVSDKTLTYGFFISPLKAPPTGDLGAQGGFGDELFYESTRSN